MSRFFKTLVAVILLTAAAVPMARADDTPNTSPRVTWTDNSTGLTWSICPLGATLVDGACNGGISKPWYLIVDDVTSSTLAGYSDWRIPSAQETLSVLKCFDSEQHLPPPLRRTQEPKQPFVDLVRVPGARGYDCPDGYAQHQFVLGKPVGLRSSLTTSLRQWLDPSAALDPDITPGRLVALSGNYDTPAFGESSQSVQTLLVRGGAPSPEWQRIVEEGRALTIAKQQREEQALADHNATEQRNKTRLKAERQAYEQRSADIRARVRAGDRVMQGLVVRVKGDLVQIQTNPRRQCLLDSRYGKSCEDIPSQLIWVERTSLKAAQ